MSKSLAAALLFAFIVLAAIFRLAPQSRDALTVEVAKFLLQFVIIVIGGAIVRMLLESAETAREAAQNRSKLRAEFLDRLGEAYRGAKKARRALRAAGLTDKFRDEPGDLAEEQIGVYVKEMEALNEVQLSLEGLKIQASSLPAFLSIGGSAEGRHGGDVSAELERMEKYLRKVVGEFEEHRSRRHGAGDSTLEFEKMPHLRDFTASGGRLPDESGRESPAFITNFAERYGVVIEMISSRLS